MAKSIPFELNPSTAIEIDGDLVARGLGLATAEFRQLMDDRKITVLCERGTGNEAGLYRASFYHDGKRVRLVVDDTGRHRTPQSADASTAEKQRAGKAP